MLFPWQPTFWHIGSSQWTPYWCFIQSAIKPMYLNISSLWFRTLSVYVIMLSWGTGPELYCGEGLLKKRTQKKKESKIISITNSFLYIINIGKNGFSFHPFDYLCSQGKNKNLTSAWNSLWMLLFKHWITYTRNKQPSQIYKMKNIQFNDKALKYIESL